MRRICPNCGRTDEEIEFYSERSHTNLCKPCNQERSRSHYQSKAPSGYYREKQLQNDYGISAEDYAQMLLEQGGVCAICGLPETFIRWGKVSQLCVDHDHETGKVRGLLCHNCNRVLGYIQDDLTWLSSATEYLER